MSKIIFLLPSLRVSGATTLFELVNGLSNAGHDVRITSLDNLVPVEYPLLVTPQKIQDSFKFFEKADAIVAYHPSCAFYINDLDVQAKKFYFLTDDVKKFFPKDLFKAKFPNLDKDRINLEYRNQQTYIDSSYQLPFAFLVTSKYLTSRKNTFVIPIGVNHELFYPDMGIPKGDNIRILVEGNLLPWKGVADINRGLSNLRGFELWTMSNTKRTIKSDKHWINPTTEELRKILSSCDILISAYREDGTADLQAKAMACGCAVVTRETAGTRMFCNDKNSLTFTKEQMIEKTLDKLMKNGKLKEELIRGGLETAKQLNWNKSITILEKALKG